MIPPPLPYLGFLSQPFMNHRTAGEGGGHFCNSSLPLPPASQALRNQPGNYCRQLTSTHRQQPDSNRGPLVSERKSLTTKPRALSEITRIHKIDTFRYSVCSAISPTASFLPSCLSLPLVAVWVMPSNQIFQQGWVILG